MKQFILLPLLLVLFANNIAAATSIIYLHDDPDFPDPRPLSLIHNPVTATISESDLSVYFEEPVATATITVYNSFNQVVEQVVVNPSITPEVHIPAFSWTAGNYTLTVHYGTTRKTGVFQIFE